MYDTIIMVMEMKIEETIKFVDENAIKKAKTVEEFRAALNVIANFVTLEHALNGTLQNYFKLLNECAEEIFSMKQKGLVISSAAFYQACKDKHDEEEREAARSRHYSSVGC